MLQLTKIFPFETAHAVFGYEGPCRNIHGHSYELHVTVAATQKTADYIAPPGFLIDFKDIKNIVKKEIVEYFDHKLVLSKNYLEAHPEIGAHENLIVWEHEPSAENILLYTRKQLRAILPEGIVIRSMRLYETKTSYAEWIED
ncbi:6-pyruvoyl tetrahydropterin synthase [compost metagenome]